MKKFILGVWFFAIIFLSWGVVSNILFAQSGASNNLSPVFTNAPVDRTGDEAIRTENEYRFDVDAVDPEGVGITFSLQSYPRGMSIDAFSGVITWTPDDDGPPWDRRPDQSGSYTVEVIASDGVSSASSRFTITVEAPPEDVFGGGNGEDVPPPSEEEVDAFDRDGDRKLTGDEYEEYAATKRGRGIRRVGLPDVSGGTEVVSSDSSHFLDTDIWRNTGTGGVSCNVKGPCVLCDALVVIANIIDLLFDASIVVTTVMFIFGGACMMLSGASEKLFSRGTDSMKYAAIGFGVVLGAWLIISTFLSILTGSGGVPWSTITCQ